MRLTKTTMKIAIFILFLFGIIYATNVCPQKCSCNEDLTSVSCESLNLTSIPDGLPLNTTSLNLRGNLIKSLHPDTNLKTLNNLRILNLTENFINTLENDCFKSTPTLEILDLSYNDLRIIDHSTFQGLNHLHSLHLFNNPHLCLEYGSIAPLISLRELNLGNTDIILFNGIFQINTLVHVPQNLSTLKLWNNKLTDVPARPLLMMKNLTYLDLRFNHITAIPARAFEGNKELKYLDLAYNPLHTIEVDAFVNLVKLKSLFLDETGTIETLPQGLFDPFKDNVQICLFGNNWNCNCSILWLHDWLVKPNRTYCAEKPICRSPEILAGTSMIRAPPEQFNCILRSIKVPYTRLKRVKSAIQYQPGYCLKKMYTTNPPITESTTTKPDTGKTPKSFSFGFIIPICIGVIVVLVVISVVVIRYLRIKKRLHDQNKYFNITYETGSQIYLAESLTPDAEKT